MSDNLSDTWMWERARNLIERADQLQKQFFQPGAGGKSGAGWAPPIDVFETRTELWVLVALPGVVADQVEVGFDGVTVTISGDRHLPEALRRAAIHRLEIPHGRFERTIALPIECTEVVRNVVEEGCLVLGLRKAKGRSDS